MTKNNATNPFGVDFTKLMGDMKVPALDFEQGVQTMRRSAEALTAANQLAFEGYQAVARRQMEIMKTSLQEASSMLSQLTSAGTPEEKIARQVELMKQAYETSLANAREIQGLVSKSNEGAIDVLSNCVCDTLDEIKTVSKKSGKKAA